MRKTFVALVPLILLAGARPHPSVPNRSESMRSQVDTYEFILEPTRRVPGSSGRGQLRISQSPFGVSLSKEGHVVYDLELHVSGLPELPAGAAFVVWLSEPDLSHQEKLGALDGPILSATISNWNKFLMIVSAERDPDTNTRAGPVVLQGRSPSGYLESFQSHELFVDVPD